jgi:hypothetical protein
MITAELNVKNEIYTRCFRADVESNATTATGQIWTFQQNQLFSENLRLQEYVEKNPLNRFTCSKNEVPG